MINNITMPVKGTLFTSRSTTILVHQIQIEGIVPARKGDTVAGHGDSHRRNQDSIVQVK